jgi:hypothetical protein
MNDGHEDDSSALTVVEGVKENTMFVRRQYHPPPYEHRIAIATMMTPRRYVG